MNENTKKRSSTNEYILLNNIYDECLTYLVDLKDNVKKIISSDEENHIDFIEEATVVEMMNDSINEPEASDDDGLDDSHDEIDDPINAVEVSHNDIDNSHDEFGDSHDEIDDPINAIEVSHDDLDSDYGDKCINVSEDGKSNHHINEATIETELAIPNKHNTNRGKNKRRISLNQDETSNNFNADAKIKSFSNEEITRHFKEDKLGNITPLGGSLLNMQHKSERLRKFSKQLPKIIITQSNASLQNGRILESDDEIDDSDEIKLENRHGGLRKMPRDIVVNKPAKNIYNRRFSQKVRTGYGNQPERLVSKSGVENVALISNVPFEKIRLLNDTFHTLINLRWRWIVSGTIVVHFAIWLIFAIFWYISALAHYDFEPNPPKKTCITGGTDFVTIFLASVEAQTTIGFGDRTIDEECPESIFLFVMQLILGTGCSGVLTCVVYAKLTRPEKLSRDGVGFSKNAVICLRDGMLCLMIRAWDLNYDHIIGSQFSAHFVHTHRTKEGEVIRYYSRMLQLEARQFLLWPVTLIHYIDKGSALYNMSPETFANNSYEIVVSLKGASASMGTFTQSQTSYLPKEILWGYKFPSVVRYDHRKQKYVIEKKRLNCVIPAEAPDCSAHDLDRSQTENAEVSSRGSPCGNHSPSSFSETVGTFHLERTSSFRKIKK